MRFLVGGYSSDMGGIADGIGMLVAGAPDDHLAGGALDAVGPIVPVDSPSWIAAHPSLDVVYAALEGRGAVQPFRRTGEASWAPLGDPVEAGDAVCHVLVAPGGSFALASCWGDGRVVRFGLDAAGRIRSRTVLAASTGVATADAELADAARALRAAAGEEFTHLVPGYDEEQEAAASDDRRSRAHQAVHLGGEVYATTDLGRDLVLFWRADAAGLTLTQEVALPRGTGPRHAVWHPSGHLYVVTEMSLEVYVLGWWAGQGSGRWKVLGGTSLGPSLTGDAAAEIAMSHDRAFVYAGVRGSNTIATLRVRGAGETLEPVALADAGVDGPRHHVVVRDTLLVAGQLSNEVASLTLDTRTGVPGRVRHRTPAPSPTHLLPVASR